MAIACRRQFEKKSSMSEPSVWLMNDSADSDGHNANQINMHVVEHRHTLVHEENLSQLVPGFYPVK
jgi:hypothetical protein